MTQTKGNALLKTTLSYFEITWPIALYVSFEALHKSDWSYLITSPEWGIASIFLAFISVTDYLESVREVQKRHHKEVNETRIRALHFARLLVLMLTVVITYVSVMDDNELIMWIRIILFIAVSIVYGLLILSSNLNENNV